MTGGRFQRLREWLPALPLLLLLGATYWLNQQVRPLSDKPDGKNRHDPDVIISKLSATTLDAQGDPHFLLSTPRMTHYPDDDSTHLETPQFSSFSPGQPPIYTTAQTGKVSSNGADVFLYDDVKILRAASGEQSERTLTTSYLHIAPERDTMDTHHPVTMTDAHNVINAVGMNFDNNSRVMKLLAQVRAQHEVIQH